MYIYIYIYVYISATVPPARVGVWFFSGCSLRWYAVLDFLPELQTSSAGNPPEFLPEIRRIGRIWQRICQILKNWLKVSSFRGAGTPEILKMQPLSSETWAARERKAQGKVSELSVSVTEFLRQAWGKFETSLRFCGLAPLRCARSALRNVWGIFEASLKQVCNKFEATLKQFWINFEAFEASWTQFVNFEQF